MSVVDSPRGIRATAFRAADFEAARRGTPNPRRPLPAASMPAVALFCLGAAVWAGATWLALAGLAPLWLTITLQALVTWGMFTVLHESVHHAAGKLTWLNETLGRLSMPFVAAYGSYPALRHIHLEHHHNLAADTGPEEWTARGRWWQLPLRWLTIDAWYVRFYARHMPARPDWERLETTATVTVAVAGMVALAVTGHGGELLAVYLIPQRIGLGLVAWWFDWLPHHDPAATHRPRARFGAARVRAGLGRLASPLSTYRDYHLAHHLHPAIPFHHYLGAGRHEVAEPPDRVLEQARPVIPPQNREHRFHPLRIAEVRPLTPDAVSVTFDVPAELAGTFRFAAGQHVTVRSTVDGQELRRTYSVCSPADSGPLRIAVKRHDGGTFSTYANTVLKTGDTLDVLPPSGGFIAIPQPCRPARYVALAGGSGITPILSILFTLLLAEEHSKATLLYVNTSGESAMFADELTVLARQFDGRLHVVHYRTDERDPDLHTPRAPRPFDTLGEALAISHERYQRGRLDGTRLRALLQGRLHPSKVDEWFLCGPGGLLDMARATLAAQDVPGENVHFELFRAANGFDSP
ncbi:fatty acid desaturase [Amycolatopsis sp. H20-H5]|uniref:fatty acid desaturase n=1 Tax=Amycolatopsis sp. H20-H5 TaxID=3046309 RepID=UPI002DB6183F|nr:fatty acid desaturase [Amycolatopsis sp. H20-H5]MEC3979113.1 fatty acid desaturase [Amycolatopsis sp. H20-H5]